MGVKMREDEWEHLLEELRRGRDLTRGLKEIEEAMTEKEKAPVET
jgi:ribosomal protein L7Ae-like RNA K-turn-binding protein